jgi:hypothetical protein
MKRKFAFSAAAAALILAAAWLTDLSSGMDTQEAIRKLSGLRISLALYGMEGKPPPASFEDVIRAGKLEEAPSLKLPWHLRSARVRNVSSRTVQDTGGWAYVNAPGDPDFGQVFMDCSHKDLKGRFWSEF